jgi:hypothetical protein
MALELTLDPPPESQEQTIIGDYNTLASQYPDSGVTSVATVDEIDDEKYKELTLNDLNAKRVAFEDSFGLKVEPFTSLEDYQERAPLIIETAKKVYLDNNSTESLGNFEKRLTDFLSSQSSTPKNVQPTVQSEPTQKPFNFNDALGNIPPVGGYGGDVPRETSGKVLEYKLGEAKRKGVEDANQMQSTAFRLRQTNQLPDDQVKVLNALQNNAYQGFVPTDNKNIGLSVYEKPDDDQLEALNIRAGNISEGNLMEAQQIGNALKQLDKEIKDNYTANGLPTPPELINQTLQLQSQWKDKIDKASLFSDASNRGIIERYNRQVEKGNLAGDIVISTFAGLNNLGKGVVNTLATLKPSDILRISGTPNPIQSKKINDFFGYDQNKAKKWIQDFNTNNAKGFDKVFYDLAQLSTPEHKEAQNLFWSTASGIVEMLPPMAISMMAGNPYISYSVWAANSYGTRIEEMTKDPRWANASLDEIKAIALPQSLAEAAIMEVGIKDVKGITGLGKAGLDQTSKIYNTLMNAKNSLVPNSGLTGLKKSIIEGGMKTVSGATTAAGTGASVSVVNDLSKNLYNLAMGDVNNGLDIVKQEDGSYDVIDKNNGKLVANEPTEEKANKWKYRFEPVTPTQIIENGVNSAKDWALMGVMMSAPMTIAGTLKGMKVDARDFAFTKSLVEDPFRVSTMYNTIKNDLATGKIDKEEAQLRIDAIKEFKPIADQIPSTLTPENQRKAFDLLNNIKKLEAQKVGKAEGLTGSIDKQIEINKNKLKEIGDAVQDKSKDDYSGSESFLPFTVKEINDGVNYGMKFENTSSDATPKGEGDKIKPTPTKVKGLGEDVNMYDDYIPSKVEDVEPTAMYVFNADSKSGIPSLLHDIAYANKAEVNGVKKENWHASISGEDLIKLYPKEQSKPNDNANNEIPNTESVTTNGQDKVQGQPETNTETIANSVEAKNAEVDLLGKTSDELYDLAKQSKDKMRQQEDEILGDKASEYRKAKMNSDTEKINEIESSLTKEQSDKFFGRNEVSLEPNEITRLAQKVSVIEQAESATDLAKSAKNAVIDLANGRKELESKAIIEAVSKKADELGITKEQLGKESLSIIGDAFGNKTDALTMIEGILSAKNPKQNEVTSKISDVEVVAKKYFSDESISRAKEAENNNEGVLVNMSIDDFLSLNPKGDNLDKKATVSKLVKEGTKFNEMPYLNFTHDGNGNAEVTGHEGRHRAMELKAQGETTIPVLLRNRAGGQGEININKESISNAKNFNEDLNSSAEKFPIKLKGHLEQKNVVIDFPLKEQRDIHVPLLEEKIKSQSKTPKEQIPFIQEVTKNKKAVTLSGNSEVKRQKLIANRVKKTTLSEGQKSESELAKKVERFNAMTPTEMVKNKDLLTAIKKDANGRFKVDNLGANRPVYVTKKTDKGKRVNIQMLRKDIGPRSIAPNGKPLHERPQEFQRQFVELIDLGIPFEFRNAEDNSKFKPSQESSALADIYDGIPSEQAEIILNHVQKAIETNQIEFGDSKQGFGVEQLDKVVAEITQAKNEEAFQSISQKTIEQLYKENADLQEKFDEIIQQEYENIANGVNEKPTEELNGESEATNDSGNTKGLPNESVVEKVQSQEGLEPPKPPSKPKEGVGGSDDFKKLVHKNIESDIVSTTLSNVERETGRELTTEEKEYNKIKLDEALDHGTNVVERAKEEFGKNYVSQLLDFLDNNQTTLSTDKKSLIQIAMELDLERQIQAKPDNVLTLEKQLKLVRDKSMTEQRSAARAIGYGRLRQIARIGYDISKITDQFFSSTELESKRTVEKAIQADADTINKQADKLEQDSVDIEQRINEAVESEVLKIYEKLPTERKKRADKAIAALESFQQKIRSKTYDATIGVPIAIIDGGITVIKRAIKAGVAIADAIDLGIQHIKEKHGKAWEKESEFREDMLNGFKEAGIKKDETVSPRKIVRDALVEAGFGRETKVKTKNGIEKRNILDWKKLTGEEGSIERMKDNVSEVLKKKGFTESEITDIQEGLKEEYNYLRASVIESSLNELNKRNKTTLTPTQKSAAKKLAEDYNYGLFEKDPSKYEILLTKAIGIDKLNPERFERARELGRALEVMYSTKMNGRKLNDIELKTAIQTVEESMRILLHDEYQQHGSTALKVANIARTYMDLSQRMILNNLKQVVDNTTSGLFQSKMTQIEKMFNGNTTKELRQQARELSNAVFKDMVLQGGVTYGDVNSTFVNRGSLDAYISKMSDNQIYHAITSTLIGKTALDAADSKYKAKLTEFQFTHNLLKILTQKRLINGKVEEGMSKEDALHYVSEKLTGQSFEDAKKTAREIISKVNSGSSKKILHDSELFVTRLANDIVKSALVNGSKITAEQVTMAYNSAYKSAGRNLGHVANNWFSKGVQGISAEIEKKINDASKEKEYKKAALLTLQSIVFRNILNPFVGGGTNWAVLKFEKNGLGLFSGLYNAGRSKLDLSTESGLKNAQKALYEEARDRDAKTRSIVGGLTAVAISTLFFGVTNEDEYRKWRNKNMWAARYLDIFTPEEVLAMMASENDKLDYYLGSLANKNDSFDKGAKIITGVSNLVKSSKEEDGTQKSITLKQKAMGKIGEAVGGILNAPVPWRMVRDGQNIWLGATGQEPYKISNKPTTSFFEGAFKAGMIDYIKNNPTVKDGEPTLFTKDDKQIPSLKYFLDKDVELPSKTFDKIPVKDIPSKTNKVVSDYSEPLQQLYKETHLRIFEKNLQSVINRGYVYKQVGYGESISNTYQKDGVKRKKIMLDDLTKKELEQVLENAERSATNKANEKVFTRSAQIADGVK